MHLNSGYQDPLKKTGRIPKSLTIRKLNINKMKINVFKSGALIKVISMTYESSLYIEFSHVDSAGNDRYKVFCDDHELTLEGYRRNQNQASNAISTLKQAYDNDQEKFDINWE
jgi:hypothetical protein